MVTYGDPIGIPTSLRPQGTYICGKSGSGKTSLLQRNILWDIENGGGVCVIDPARDLVNAMLPYIPAERLRDVILFDTSMPVALDFFSYQREDKEEKDDLVDYIASIFNLENAPIAKPHLISLLYTLFEAREAGLDSISFLDIHRFLMHPSRQAKILAYCSRERREEWARPLPHDTRTAIVKRMTRFVENSTLRAIVGCPNPLLNMEHVISEKKILFVTLKESETGHFIGSLVVAKLQQAIFKLAGRHASEASRVPFYLYVDECNTILEFAADTFDTILQRARKFKLCLTMANVTPKKLPEKIRDCLGILGSLVIFNLDPAHGQVFKSQIAPHLVDELTNLPKFHALFRTDNKTTAVRTPSFLPPRENGNAQYVRTRTLDLYSCKSAPVSDTSEDGTKPDPEPTLPHDASKEPGTPTPQRVFRPDDKPARHATKRQGSH